MNGLFAQITKTEINVPQGDFTASSFQHILQIVFGTAGGAALIIIIYAGFMYVKSQANPQEVAKAKSTILYAGIGLAVCILAFSIVSFTVAHL
jgi:type IV secretory pathway VirB2 component (pilin)